MVVLFFLELEVLSPFQECFEAPLPLASKGNIDFAPRKQAKRHFLIGNEDLPSIGIFRGVGSVSFREGKPLIRSGWGFVCTPIKNENLLRIPMMAAEMAVIGASPDGDLWCVFCVFGW